MSFNNGSQSKYGYPPQQQTSSPHVDFDFKSQTGQWKSQKNVFASNLQYAAPTPLPLGKTQQAVFDSSSPMTKRTAMSSNLSSSELGSDEDLD